MVLKQHFWHSCQISYLLKTSLTAVPVALSLHLSSKSLFREKRSSWYTFSASFTMWKALFASFGLTHPLTKCVTWRHWSELGMGFSLDPIIQSFNAWWTISISLKLHLWKRKKFATSVDKTFYHWNFKILWRFHEVFLGGTQGKVWFQTEISSVKNKG